MDKREALDWFYMRHKMCLADRCQEAENVAIECIAKVMFENTPRLLAFQDVMRGCGGGWAEQWFQPDPEEGTDEYKELTPVAWCKGNLIFEDGDSQDRDNLKRMYNKKYGTRIWSARPTDTQMEAIPWK